MKRYSYTDLGGSGGFSRIIRLKEGESKFQDVAMSRIVKMELNPFYLSSATSLGADISRRIVAMDLALSALCAGANIQPSAGAAHCAWQDVFILGAEQRSRSRNKAQRFDTRTNQKRPRMSLAFALESNQARKTAANVFGINEIVWLLLRFDEPINDSPTALDLRPKHSLHSLAGRKRHR